MKLNTPIHKLKQQAKALKRAESISMVAALDRIAKTQGFNTWSLLHAKADDYAPQTAQEILSYISPGDLMLLAARPNLGKTKLAMQILLKAIAQQRQCFFYSFEFTHAQAVSIFTDLDVSFNEHNPLLNLYFSDQIAAEYIINTSQNMVEKASLIVVDYLQLLDQQRSKPPIQQQIQALKAYAADTGCIIICISQIDREFEPNENVQAALQDIRLPNPLDLSLFNKSIFI